MVSSSSADIVIARGSQFQITHTKVVVARRRLPGDGCKTGVNCGLWGGARAYPQESGRGSYYNLFSSYSERQPSLLESAASSASYATERHGPVVTARSVPRGSEGRGATEVQAAADPEIRQEGDPETAGHRDLDGGAACRPIPG